MRAFGMRFAAGVLAAIALGIGAGACDGDDPDEAGLSRKIQAGVDGVSKDAADCMAKVTVEYAKANVIDDYLVGDVEFRTSEKPRTC